MESFEHQFGTAIGPMVERLCQNINHTTMELECRLGKYDEKGHFDTNIGVDAFNYLLAYHSRSFDPIKSNTTINRYADSNLRTDSRFPSTLIKKVVWDKKDFPEYGCRMALSDEEEVNIADCHPTITHTRKRERWSFRLHPHLRLDLTQVTSPPQSSTATYQVELELLYHNVDSVIPGKSHLAWHHFMNVFVQGVQKLLQYTENTPVLLSLTYQTKLDEKMNEITTRLGRIQTYQPRTFHQEDLANTETMYAMTDKIDGRRALLLVGLHGLYVRSTSSSIAAGSNKPWKCFGQFPDQTVDSLQYSIIEGELTERKFYAFDLIVYKDKDLRMQAQETLPRRLEKLQNVIESCQHIHGGTIQMKQYYYGTIPELFETTRQCILRAETNAHYMTDGLIFTPMREPHPRHGQQAWNTQLKWKPDVTLDVRCLDQKPMVVGESGAEEVLQYKYQGASLRFDLYPIEAQQYENKIVECNIQANGVLNILRTRPDKLKPNYIAIILDNIRAIERPVTYEHITGKASLEDEYDPESNSTYTKEASPSTVVVPDVTILQGVLNKIQQQHQKHAKVMATHKRNTNANNTNKRRKQQHV